MGIDQVVARLDAFEDVFEDKVELLCTKFALRECDAVASELPTLLAQLDQSSPPLLTPRRSSARLSEVKPPLLRHGDVGSPTNTLQILPPVPAFPLCDALSASHKGIKDIAVLSVATESPPDRVALEHKGDGIDHAGMAIESPVDDVVVPDADLVIDDIDPVGLAVESPQGSGSALPPFAPCQVVSTHDVQGVAMESPTLIS